MLIAALVRVPVHCVTVYVSATHDFLNQQDYWNLLVGQFYTKLTINSKTYVLGIVLGMIAKIYQEIDGRFLGCQAHFFVQTLYRQRYRGSVPYLVLEFVVNSIDGWPESEQYSRFVAVFT